MTFRFTGRIQLKDAFNPAVDYSIMIESMEAAWRRRGGGVAAAWRQRCG